MPSITKPSLAEVSQPCENPAQLSHTVLKKLNQMKEGKLFGSTQIKHVRLRSYLTS